MKTLKKISATEFRLHLKNFVIDTSPINYFEKLRFNILFSRLLFWFFRRYGVYLFSYQVRILDEKILFQFFYYRTYFFIRHWRIQSSRKVIWSTMPLIQVLRNKKQSFSKFSKYLSPLLMTKGLWYVSKNDRRGLRNPRFHFITKYFNRVIVNKSKKLANTRWELRRRWLDRFKFYRVGSYVFFLSGWHRHQFLQYYSRSIFRRFYNHAGGNTRWLKKIYFNFFFLYFFLFFFKRPSVILYKSMYKHLIVNKSFKREHKYILKRLRYLRKYEWSFDFLFFFHYAVNFLNFDFVFPFFVYNIKNSYKQRPFLTVFFNVAKTFYYLKTHIRGIKVLVHGPYDRHGRSRTLVLRIGDVSFISYDSFILYDLIQWPTFYGTTHIKLWIEYKVPTYSYSKKDYAII